MQQYSFIKIIQNGFLFCALTLLAALKASAASLPNELLNAPITLMSGEKTSLAQYKGKKPVYLKFLATWCQPCREQMPHFEHVQQQYGDAIEVIGINVGLNDDIEEVNKVIKEFALTMPMAIDENGDLAQKFRLIGTPYHLLFDKDMNLVHTGHEADESLDNNLALVVATDKNATLTLEALNPSVLIESEKDIALNTNDGKVHAVLFTATWCDWYWAESRAVAAKECITAQNTVNALANKFPDVEWTGAVSRLWTEDKDLADYTKKYKIAMPMHIDKSNRLFHQYKVTDIPELILIKDNKAIQRVRNFKDIKAISALLAEQKK